MIDYFCVLTTGGITLFSRLFNNSIKGTPIDNLITNILIEQRTGESLFKDGSYAVRWSLNNELGLIFVVLYNKLLPQIAGFAESVLSLSNKNFSRLYNEVTSTAVGLVPPSVFRQKFDPIFDKIFAACEGRPTEGLTSQAEEEAATATATGTAQEGTETETSVMITTSTGSEISANEPAIRSRTKKVPRAPKPCKKKKKENKQTNIHTLIYLYV